jgi:hypothetical protein
LRDYGIDLNRLARAFVQTPEERYREAVAAMRALERFKK